MNASATVKEKATISNYDMKIERAKKSLASCGITEEVLKKGHAEGKTTPEIFREVSKTFAKNKQNNKILEKEQESDWMLEAIVDEWMQQAETIEQLRKKIQSLEAKYKKQKARIAGLEAQLAAKEQAAS